MRNTIRTAASLFTATALSLALHAHDSGLLTIQEPASGAKSQTTSTAPPAAMSEAVSQQWQQFAQRHEGAWTTRWCAATGTPSAIFGPGLVVADWPENSLAEARRHADILLQQQSELLGLGTSEFREIIGNRMGRTWTLVYDQFFRGLPVIGGRADVRVHMVGRVAMFGSRAWPVPANFGTVPTIPALTATGLAWTASTQQPSTAAQPGTQRAPRLVIYGDVEATTLAPFYLAWEIPISAVLADGTGPIGRYYIDANTGGVLHYTNDKHQCGNPSCGLHLSADALRPPLPEVATATSPAALPTAALPPATGTVMAWTRLGTTAVEPLTNVPLAGVEVNVPGVGIVVTDSNGNFTANIPAATSVTVRLDGRHSNLIAGANAPTVTQTLTPNGTTTFQFLTSGATANEAAHTSTHYWVDAMNELCRSILGNSPELIAASNVQPTVNIGSTCNAYYTGNSINFYSAGGGCNNTAYSTVVGHEWGHGLDDVYGGISQTNGLSEAWGDICGMYLVDDPLIADAFYTSGAFLRTGNNTHQYPNGSGPHDQGQSFMGFAWKLRQQLANTLSSRAAAIAVTNDILFSSIAANALNQHDAVLEVFIADDDDGILLNGTPHSPELAWACNQHSLPYPGQGGPANNDCIAAGELTNGLNGPFTTIGASTSLPAWPCGGSLDVWFRYPAGATGTLQIDLCGQASWDTTLQIFSGSCGSLTSVGCNNDSCGLQSSLSIPVTPGVYYVRVGGNNLATGLFSLNVNGPLGSYGAVSEYGTGCYFTSKAFYEDFSSASTFDLNGVGMQLVNAGNSYVAMPSGTYVPPTTSAQQLTLGDDSFTTVALNSALPYPGGSTTTLEVCSNGFVSVATGNGSGYTPSVNQWLGSAAARWGTWHDFNPSTGASGKVKFEQVGQIAYVTWDGVFSYGTSSPETWQLQFDLSNGNVTYVWQSLSGNGNGILVGYAAAAPNNDLGSLDVSVALPATFRTGSANNLPLALNGTVPTLGSNFTLTTTGYPAGSGLGIQVLSFIKHDPGLDLTSAGMPGCRQFTGTEAIVYVVPVSGQSTFVTPIPTNGAFIGLALHAQTYALAPGANTLGLIASNGVESTVGL